MEYTYHIIYSCYTRKMQILLNNKDVLSQSSSVIQYMNEPFYVWCEQLLPLLYRELGESFHLIFTGRDEEAEVLRALASGFSFCLSFETRSFGVSVSLQERMIALSRFMKESSIPALPPVRIQAVFVGSPKVLTRWSPLIDQLEIKNPYCRTEFRKMVWNGTEHLLLDEIPFFLSDGSEQTEACCNRTPVLERYAFVLEGKAASFVEDGAPAYRPGYTSSEDGFISLEKGHYIYSFSEDTFFSTVFDCFFLFPLVDAFSKYTLSLLPAVKDVKKSLYLQYLLSVKPVIHIEAEDSVEVGRSVPFRIRMEPPDAPVPPLSFEYQFPGIVDCTDLRVYGMQTGKTQIRVFEKGEVNPVASFTITVFRRNRIDHILLSEHSLTVGVGDVFTLHCDYMPPDADNADQIRWITDQAEIASVDRHGRVTVKKPGRCRIFCSAEQVSASCSILAKPYLQSISLPEDVKEGILHLGVGEQKNLLCRELPEDAYDGRLIYSSSNLMVLNMDGSRAVGVSDGEADVFVCNSSKRLKLSFHVVVGNGNKPMSTKKKFLGLF